MEDDDLFIHPTYWWLIDRLEATIERLALKTDDRELREDHRR